MTSPSRPLPDQTPHLAIPVGETVKIDHDQSTSSGGGGIASNVNAPSATAASTAGPATSPLVNAKSGNSIDVENVKEQNQPSTSGGDSFVNPPNSAADRPTSTTSGGMLKTQARRTSGASSTNVGRSTSKSKSNGEEFHNRLKEIYRDEDGAKFLLQEWKEEVKDVERMLDRLETDKAKADEDLHQVMGFFFVFQGVLITATSNLENKECRHRPIILALSITASFFAIINSIACLYARLLTMEQIEINNHCNSSLKSLIQHLKNEGVAFQESWIRDRKKLQQPITPTQKDQTSHTRSKVFTQIEYLLINWVFGYAMVVLVAISSFGCMTFIAIHQILC